jgi:hypothetical protein
MSNTALVLGLAFLFFVVLASNLNPIIRAIAAVLVCIGIILAIILRSDREEHRPW